VIIASDAAPENTIRRGVYQARYPAEKRKTKGQSNSLDALEARMSQPFLLKIIQLAAIGGAKSGRPVSPPAAFVVVSNLTS
jgi:hypothetical protein